MGFQDHLIQLLLTLVYAVVGLGVFAVAYLIFDRVVPFSVRKEIEVDQNAALAIVLGSVMVGLAIIIAAAIA